MTNTPRTCGARTSEINSEVLEAARKARAWLVKDAVYHQGTLWAVLAILDPALNPRLRAARTGPADAGIDLRGISQAMADALEGSAEQFPWPALLRQTALELETRAGRAPRGYHGPVRNIESSAFKGHR